jgi:hypothetical protein
MPRRAAGSGFEYRAKHLFDGGREAAKQHFRRIIEQDMFTDSLPYSVVGHLDRLEQDPAWPAFRVPEKRRQ